MENDARDTEQKPVKEEKWYSFIGPAIAGLVVAKLFGLIGALALFVTYFVAKPKLGTIGALVLSVVVGLGVAFAAGAWVRSM